MVANGARAQVKFELILVAFLVKISLRVVNVAYIESIEDTQEQSGSTEHHVIQNRTSDWLARVWPGSAWL